MDRPAKFLSSPTSTPGVNRPRRLNPSHRHRRYGWHPSAATTPSASNSKSLRHRLAMGRPNVQTVTLMASAVIFFTIVMLVRTAAIVPDHAQEVRGTLKAHRVQRAASVPKAVRVPTTQKNPTQSKSQARPHIQRHTNSEAKPGNVNNENNDNNNDNNSLTGLVAGDGSHFLADLSGTRFEILYTGTQSRLYVDTVNRRISKKKAKLAFFIQVSDSNLRLLSRLLIVMWHPHHLYLIHFDAKVNPATREQFVQTIQKNELLSDNVFVLEADVITYKGVSMLLNTLAAIEFLLEKSPDWDYFINLSGSDYPMVNSDTMSRILGESPIVSQNKSFIQIATNKRFWHSMKQSRFDLIYYDNALSMNKSSSSKLLSTWIHHPLFHDHDVGIEFVQAEAWIIAHRSFAAHSVRSNQARKLLLLLSMMQDPEEHFFAMLAWNSPVFNQTLAHHSFRAVFWELHGKMSGQHPYYIDNPDKDGSFPLWEGHLTLSRCFFARKVKHPHSPLLTRIDRFMSGTHPDVSKQSVSSNITAVRQFVHCIADVDPSSDQIRSTNMC